MNLYQYRLDVKIDSEYNTRGYVINKQVFENVKETSRYYISETPCHTMVPKENVGLGHLGVAYLLEDNFEKAKRILAFYVQTQIDRQNQIIEDAFIRKNEFMEKLACVEEMQEEIEEERDL